MNKWVIMYISANGKPFKMSRAMNHAKAMARYLKELEVRTNETLYLMKIVSDNGAGL